VAGDDLVHRRRHLRLLRDARPPGLELSEEKTLITHARTGAAKFLGYEITARHGDHMCTAGRRTGNGSIGLRVPLTVIKAKCAPYVTRGQPALPELECSRGCDRARSWGRVAALRRAPGG
jgi:hypothetical protein